MSRPPKNFKLPDHLDDYDIFFHSCGSPMFVGIISQGEDDEEFKTYAICPNCKTAAVLLKTGAWEDERFYTKETN